MGIQMESTRHNSASTSRVNAIPSCLNRTHGTQISNSIVYLLETPKRPKIVPQHPEVLLQHRKHGHLQPPRNQPTLPRPPNRQHNPRPTTLLPSIQNLAQNHPPLSIPPIKPHPRIQQIALQTPRDHTPKRRLVRLRRQETSRIR